MKKRISVNRIIIGEEYHIQVTNKEKVATILYMKGDKLEEVHEGYCKDGLKLF